jgi:asparagine synthase (glutamine-hydrolysing)
MIKGWIDLSSVASKAPIAVEQEAAGSSVRRVRSLGLEADTGGENSDLAVDGALLVACEGDARFADTSAARVARERGQAAGWIELLRERREKGLGLAAGSYAVVFVDLTSRTVQLACDRFAIHPLCYALEGQRLAFADRADEVATDARRDIDPQAIYDYLYFHVIPTPRTIYRGVFRLPPAHVAYVSRAGVKVAPHWVPIFEERSATNLADLKEEFRALVHGAVEREALGHNVGCFLSGGTDSSTVTGMLGEVSGQPAATYSIGFQAEGYDEMDYARIAARHFGARHHEYYVTPDDLVRGIPTVARYYDQPFGNSSALPAYYCARAAKADGVEKLLAGDGGDELFGGNTRYATQRVFQAYYGIPAVIRRTLIEPVLLSNAWLEKVPLARKAVRYVQQALVPMPDRMNNYNLLDWLGAREIAEQAFLSQVDTNDPARQQRATYGRVNGSLVNAMLAYDWKYTLADNDLPKVCRTTALAGVAVGFPLLADEIVDFSLRLPSSLKLRGLKLRYFFKEALRGFLPDATIAKRKHGFGLPFGLWLSQYQPLRELARTALASLAQRGIVRPRFVDDLIDRRMFEHVAFFGEMVWILIMLEHWLSAKAPQFSIGDQEAASESHPWSATPSTGLL